jgi:biopolymer transport protein ExbB
MAHLMSETAGRRWLLALSLGLGLGLGLPAEGAEPAGLAESARVELQQALAELADVQAVIGAERLPLAQRLNRLEEELLSARQEYDKAQRAQDNRMVELGALRRDVERAREQTRFMSALLTEAVNRFESRIHISEVDRHADLLAEVKAAATHADWSPAQRLEGQAALLAASAERLEQAMGGVTFEGKALMSRGTYETGEYLVAGPMALFASRQSEAAGLAELRVGSPRPRVIEPTRPMRIMVRDLIEGRGENLPLDSTGGNALKIASTKDGLWAHVRKGGPVMVPILLLGLVATVISGIKWSHIARIRMIGPMDLQEILNHLRLGQREEARARVEQVRGPMGEMLGVALAHVDEPKEYLEEVMYEKMLDTKPRLEALLPVIALTAACAPLLGLLGTVTGMINTFNMISVFGAGDPRTLSGGISEALITTEFGLIVAIPALLMHAFLSRKVKGVMGSMEQTTVAFINGVETPEMEGA